MNNAGTVHHKSHFGVTAGGRKRQPKEILCARPDTLFFRAQTLAIVKHFFEISCQIGRLPSILGREFFRAKVSHHGIPSFEDQAVFVYDVEQALAKLSPQHLEVVSLVGLYQYSLEEVAKLLGRCRRTVVDRYVEGVDALSEVFLASGMLKEDRPDRRIQRFEVLEARSAAVTAMPPKKPAGSVAAEAANVAAKYSFAAQHRVV